MNSWTTLTESRQRKWTTEAATELIQAQLGLRHFEVIVLEVGRVETFIAMLSKTTAVIFVGPTTRLKLDSHSAIT